MATSKSSVHPDIGLPVEISAYVSAIVDEDIPARAVIGFDNDIAGQDVIRYVFGARPCPQRAWRLDGLAVRGGKLLRLKLVTDNREQRVAVEDLAPGILVVSR